MDFIGNKKAVDTLQRAIGKSSLNHAYIFSGPEKVGKFTLARKFALAAIGDSKKISQVEDNDSLLDLIVVEPEIVEKNKVAKQRDISIETIREAKMSMSLFPYKGKYKVLIVNDAHKLNVAAQNGLLKMLEEPNATSIIILITHELDRILPTILSRCQMINFSLVGGDEMRKEFEDEADLSIGRPGIGNNLRNNPEEKKFRIESYGQFEKMLYGSISEKFSLAEEYSKDIVKTLQRMNIWVWEFRKRSNDLSLEQRSEIYVKIEKIQEASKLLKSTNANSRLILETLFMDL
ncbi:MAG: hypothetical protein ACD_5C00139G0006 [uncultured bacterium]|nr:MAG: hypothetical protein ACD_5C00139G0006 [uncultured bacterium]